jgi:Flp pilus assembly protein TadG
METPTRADRVHNRRDSRSAQEGTRRRSRGRGQAVVEFALILPVFLMLTIGVVDMARVFTSYVELTNGVSSAALYGGNGGYFKWCSATGVIACKTGTAAANKAGDPDNIAYQIQIETTGLTTGAIDLGKPQCNTPGAPTVFADCTLATAGTYSSVRVGANYTMTLLTPIISNLVGPVKMSAETTAAIIQ